MNVPFPVTLVAAASRMRKRNCPTSAYLTRTRPLAVLSNVTGTGAGLEELLGLVVDKLVVVPQPSLLNCTTREASAVVAGFT